MPLSLRGSAICTNIVSVCTTAVCAADNTTVDTTPILDTKDCELTTEQGLLDYFTIVVLFAILVALTFYQSKVAEKIDVSEQTAQDYAIIVQDPDKDATDPEKWRAFFSKFGHVTYVTVALDNGDLLQALASRRSIVNSLMVRSRLYVVVYMTRCSTCCMLEYSNAKCHVVLICYCCTAIVDLSCVCYALTKQLETGGEGPLFEVYI
jgi:hypothetical protein